MAQDVRRPEMRSRNDYVNTCGMAAVTCVGILLLTMTVLGAALMYTSAFYDRTAPRDCAALDADKCIATCGCALCDASTSIARRARCASDTGREQNECRQAHPGARWTAASCADRDARLAAVFVAGTYMAIIGGALLTLFCTFAVSVQCMLERAIGLQRSPWPGGPQFRLDQV
jgi:hypothetical protein